MYFVKVVIQMTSRSVSLFGSTMSSILFLPPALRLSKSIFEISLFLCRSCLVYLCAQRDTSVKDGLLVSISDPGGGSGSLHLTPTDLLHE